MGTKRAGPHSQPARTHLDCESVNPQTRHRVLHHLCNALVSGVRDPELLYLGARYAASLGLKDTAYRFLCPLTAMLVDGTNKTTAFLPVGLLYLYVLPPGGERDAMLRDVRSLSRKSVRLQRISEIVFGDAQGRFISGSPQDLLARIRQDGAETRLLIAESMDPPTSRSVAAAAPTGVAVLARNAQDAYIGRDLPASRHALEELLLRDADNPDVLRNLVAVTSEQRDQEAYSRYWRRYVKVSFWRMMRNDQPMAAWDDLIRFYVHVAMTTDREFAQSGPRIAERLRRPGLLERWTESHAALAWLDTAMRPYRRQQAGLGEQDLARGRLGYLALMRCWFRIFYPEFVGFVDLGGAEQNGFPAPAGRRQCRLPFDPAEKLLTRFAEWSKAAFGLQSREDSHVDGVVALAEIAARIPTQSYVRKLQKAFHTDQANRELFRHTMQKACSIGLRFRIEGLLEKEDWGGLLAFHGEPDMMQVLTPALRLFVALGTCKAEQAEKGLDLALETAPDMQAEDFEKESQSQVLWRNILQANIGAVLNDEKADPDQGFRRLREKIEKIDGPPAMQEFRKSCLDTLNEAYWRVEVRRAIEKSKELVSESKFDEARGVIRRLPDQPKELTELKQKLLEQIGEAEQQHRIHKQIESAIEESKKLVERGKFEEARHLIHRLPDQPKELAGLKRNLLGQIADAEQQHRIHAQIESAIDESRKLVERGKFDEARRLIHRLPDQPKELADLKKNLQGQIADAERQHKVHAQIESAIEESKRLVGEGKLDEARRTIQGLPDQPSQLSALKRNLLGQIDEVDNQQRSVTRENAELMRELSKRNVDLSKIPELARMNNLDMSNPHALNALLKAIKEHLPY